MPGMKGAAGWKDAPLPQARLDFSSFRVPRLWKWISAQSLHHSHSQADPQLGAECPSHGSLERLWLVLPFPRSPRAASQRNNLWKKQEHNINYFLTNPQLSDHPGSLLRIKIPRVKHTSRRGSFASSQGRSQRQGGTPIKLALLC